MSTNEGPKGLGRDLEMGRDGVAVVVETTEEVKSDVDLELEARRQRLRSLSGGALSRLSKRASFLTRTVSDSLSADELDNARIANIHDEVRKAVGGN